MSLSQRIDEDFRKALKESDKLRLSVLRLVKAAVKNREIDKGRTLSDEDIISIFSTLAKQCRESIEQFSKGGRDDLAEQERSELAILQSYMPEQLSAEKLEEIIRQAIKESSVRDVTDIGKVMRILMPRIKGLADGRLVNNRVRELLESPN
ncbi:MAG: GatB/YqeY domain-containing protein [Nitrospirota bacterium]|nr:GatB/YqeY domain-containing protein [Nitrospirota bacterium]